MARIPEAFIQDLLQRLDVVEVVERYLPLKKAGQNYVACCPFHKEKSPSFTVSQLKQFYHCFGCGAHGSALNFVMTYEGRGFVEAVEKLAESVGMAVPQHTVAQPAPEVVHRIALLAALNDTAVQFYRARLRESDRAKDYLKHRGLTGKVAAQFGLGYAPEGWQPLAAAFADYATQAGLAEAGLVIDQADSGRRYDRFRDRIMFPILDAKGVCIGFGGRIIDKGEPKYLNSPETPLFQKGRELYGLPQAREAIRASNRVLVVEGYMDVVALAQLEVGYAVATLGTACTPDHVKKLLRLADDVIFCFDGDAAGRRAAWRALENSLPHARDSKRLAFLFLPAQHDPDSYIRAHGKPAFESMLADESVGLAAFLLRELSSQVDLNSEEGRARLVHLASPLLQQVQAPALRAQMSHSLAELSRLTPADIARLVDGVAGTTPEPVARKPGRPPAAPPVASRGRPAADLGRELLQLLMFQPAFALEVPHNLLQAEQGDLALRIILRVVDYVAEQVDPPLPGHLLTALRDDPAFESLQEAQRKGMALYGAGFDESALQAQWEGTLSRFLRELERSRLMHRRESLEQRLAQVGLAGLTADEKEEWRRLALFR